MNNINWDFIEAYKSLDELCKQILSSDRGISEYIDEMSNERLGRMMVACWEKDYNQLKKMRWIRNQLVHEVNSSQSNLVTIEDIEWLKTFRSRIMECTDSFSLLREARNIKRKTTVKQEKPLETYSQINEPSNSLETNFQTNESSNPPEIYSQTSEPSSDMDMLAQTIIFIAIAIAIGIAIGILGIIFYLYFVLNKF